MHWAYGKTLKQIKYEAILAVLAHNNWNRTYSAQDLNISVRTLRIIIHNMALDGIKIPTNGSNKPAYAKLAFK